MYTHTYIHIENSVFCFDKAFFYITYNNVIFFIFLSKLIKVTITLEITIVFIGMIRIC